MVLSGRLNRQQKESGPGPGTLPDNMIKVKVEEVHNRARHGCKNNRDEVRVQTLSVTGRAEKDKDTA